jgi:hypothetical protein
VRRHLLVQQLRAPLTGRFGVLFEQVGKSPTAQWFAASEATAYAFVEPHVWQNGRICPTAGLLTAPGH